MTIPFQEKPMLDETDETVIRRVMRDARPGASAQSARPRRASEKLAWTLPGFCANARVQTSFGHVPIEALRPHDPVRTKAGDYLAVAWVDRIQLDAEFLMLHPAAYPVRLPAGCIDRGVPCRDILLSTAQVLHLPHRTGANARCTAATLVGRRRIRREAVPSLTYFMFHCGRPATVWVDGLWVDTAPD
ncbi:Hint domain-containing protein [Sulfitobacter sp. D35]|uniref:Hint domain-containing protein n=1 Tax=Sulfitobacter sp. D35 TaxID=3083252 RepID=UPI00296EE8A7|nr:Hint domain-containing protein [Sulfitobacter sp. D35]MDW4499978.1 Hint domain-containing protein [Sulfitobacter sp. D35]